MATASNPSATSTTTTAATTSSNVPEQDVSEQLKKAITCTQQLRSTVSKVFRNLGTGFQNTQENEKAIVTDVQNALLDLNQNLTDLEQVGRVINPDHLSGLPNSRNLNLDPSYDRLALYPQLLNGYKWMTKTSEFASSASVFVPQGSLKRVNHPLSSKRTRRQSTSHSVAPADVDTLLPGWNRLFGDMTVTLRRPSGNSSILVVTLGKTMRIVLSLRGLLIQQVKVRGYKENFVSENGVVDLWTSSRYDVFKSVTNSTTAAMLHFYHPVIPEISMRSFFTWLHSYNDLFSASCHKCQKHLKDALPPTYRDLRNTLPYHEACRP